MMTHLNSIYRFDQQLLLWIALVLLTACGTTESITAIENEINQIENGLLKAIVVEGDSENTYSIQERMDFHKVPGISIAVVQNGQLKWAKGYGYANTTDSTKVNTNTLFQAGSISKPVAALAALKLMEEGEVDLDTDVNTYLKNWKVENNEFTTNKKVTLRRLLTHTAGMTVHGFPGYQQSDTFPTITQVLNGEGNTPKIFVDTTPDSIWRYSGGGYTVMEKVVEDVSGLTLETYMDQNILAPLNMVNSTYTQPLSDQYHANASAAYDTEGTIIEGLWHNYPEQAAAGLWTTPTDLATYCMAIQDILSGKETSILTKSTIEKMLTKHKNDWGLGPSLAWGGDSLRFQHGGKNAGFTNNMIAFAYSGNAVIVMTNADNGGKLIGEILRSISKYYDWGIVSPRMVALAEPNTVDLDALVGKYLYAEKVPDIGDYFVELTREGETLVVNDPNNGEVDIISAMDSSTFIDLEDGDEVVFTVGDTTKFLWNGQFQFVRVK